MAGHAQVADTYNMAFLGVCRAQTDFRSKRYTFLMINNYPKCLEEIVLKREAELVYGLQVRRSVG